MSRQEQFVAEVRLATRKIIDGYNELEALKKEWDALDYATTIPEAGVEGDHAGINRAAIADVVGTSRGALASMMAAGNATNLHKVI